MRKLREKKGQAQSRQHEAEEGEEPRAVELSGQDAEPPLYTSLLSSADAGPQPVAICSQTESREQPGKVKTWNRQSLLCKATRLPWRCLILPSPGELWSSHTPGAEELGRKVGLSRGLALRLSFP